MILVAPNAFKGTLDAREVCRIISSELVNGSEEVISLPQGDGGDGTAGIVASYLHASPLTITGCDALGRENRSVYYLHEDTAIIELAEVCGLKQLRKEEYDVLNANTRGLGVAIVRAIENNARKIILCVGGSASIDGGTGALAEMGLTVVKSGDKYRNHIVELEDVDASCLLEKFKDVEFHILCDVDNVLCGLEGSAAIFGPQKGASPLQVEFLDEKLQAYAVLLKSITGIDIRNIKYGGAAGGITASFAGILGAKLQSGSEYCLKLSGFEHYLEQARLVITGEGRLDNQSMYGKIPGVVASKANRKGVRVVAIAGSADVDTSVFNKVFTLDSCAPSLNEAISHPEYYLRLACRELCFYLSKD